MKKLCIIFLLCFLSETISYAEIYDIDEVVKECSSENYMTDGMNKCTLQGIAAWEKDIVKYSNEIKKYLSDDELKMYNNSEQAWENYYNNEKNFLNQTVFQKSGDIHTTFVINDLYELTKFRALMLKRYLLQMITNY